MNQGVVSIEELKYGKGLNYLVEKNNEYYLKMVDFGIESLKNFDNKFETENEKILRIVRTDYSMLNQYEKEYIAKTYVSVVGSNNLKDRKYDDAQTRSMKDYLQNYYLKYALSRKQNIQKYVEECREYATKKIILTLPKEDILKNIKYANMAATELLEKGKDVTVAICCDMHNESNSTQANYLYSSQERSAIIALNNNLAHRGMKRQIVLNEIKNVESFIDLKNCWTLSEVLKANSEIDRVVQFIKDNNFSPYETMLYIHKYITTNFVYNEEDLSKASVIVGAFANGKYIVCSGYSSLTKAIIDRLENSNLKAEFITGIFYKNINDEDIEMFAHSQCLISIKDEKYGVIGKYVNDASRDSKTLFYPKGKGFANCMMPIGDMKKYKGMAYDQYHADSRYQAIISSRGHERILNNIEFMRLENFKDRYEYVKAHSEQEVVKKYADQSDAIDIETIKNAITNVVIAINGYVDKSSLNKNVQHLVDISIKNAKDIFMPTAQNAFVINQQPEQKRQRRSQEDAEFER